MGILSSSVMILSSSVMTSMRSTNSLKVTLDFFLSVEGSSLVPSRIAMSFSLSFE
jgi:hypothetical protein